LTKTLNTNLPTETVFSILNLGKNVSYNWFVIVEGRVGFFDGDFSFAIFQFIFIFGFKVVSQFGCVLYGRYLI